MLSRFLLASLVFGCLQANAVRFRNAYISFDLPPNWNCKLEGSEWVCESQLSQKTKEAIIILTAKEVGPTDTLAAYKAHLLTPRTLQGKGGQTTKSQIISAQERNIRNQPWIDALHLGSEVGPYFTRYLATIKDRIAILVTFSAHKEHYTKYSNDFIRAVDSLQIVASKDTLAGRDNTTTRDTQILGTGMGGLGAAGVGDEITPNGVPEEGSGKASGKYFNLMMIAVILLAIGFYLFTKTKKKPQPKKKTK